MKKSIFYCEIIISLLMFITAVNVFNNNPFGKFPIGSLLILMMVMSIFNLVDKLKPIKYFTQKNKRDEKNSNFHN